MSNNVKKQEIDKNKYHEYMHRVQIKDRDQDYKRYDPFYCSSQFQEKEELKRNAYYKTREKSRNKSPLDYHNQKVLSKPDRCHTDYEDHCNNYRSNSYREISHSPSHRRRSNSRGFDHQRRNSHADGWYNSAVPNYDQNHYNHKNQFNGCYDNQHYSTQKHNHLHNTSPYHRENSNQYHRGNSNQYYIDNSNQHYRDNCNREQYDNYHDQQYGFHNNKFNKKKHDSYNKFKQTHDQSIKRKSALKNRKNNYIDHSSSDSYDDKFDNNYRTLDLDNPMHYRTYDGAYEIDGNCLKDEKVTFGHLSNQLHRLNMHVPYVNPVKTYTKNNRKSAHKEKFDPPTIRKTQDDNYNAYWSTQYAFDKNKALDRMHEPDYGKVDFHEFGYTGETRNSTKDYHPKREQSNIIRQKSLGYNNTR